MGSRYFSRYRVPRTTRKQPLRSASSSAMGVPTSSGIRVISAEAEVEAASSSVTVVFLSSSERMAWAWVSGSERWGAATKMESSAARSSSPLSRKRVCLDRSCMVPLLSMGKIIGSLSKRVKYFEKSP